MIRLEQLMSCSFNLKTLVRDKEKNKRMMKHKVFKVLAIICSIIAVICITTLDSPSLVPMCTCVVCLSYLAIYATVKGCEIDIDIDTDEDEDR